MQRRVLQVSGSDNVHEAFEKFRLLEETTECGQRTIERSHAHAHDDPVQAATEVQCVACKRGEHSSQEAS